MNDVRLIAFYLPQFHPIKENDAWWGKGFTEWTNVSSARRVFPQHYQPHIPADLGFYDLRLEKAREEQAALAHNYGIHGFCYYYYYFNGKRLLNIPLDEVLASGKPDFPFCVCWANENWTRRWDGKNDDILIEQSHSPEDDREFISQLLPALKDKRYIRVNNKLLLLVYRTDLLPDPMKTAGIWRDFVRNETGDELYLCAVNNFVKDLDPATVGFDGIVQFPLSVPGECFIDKKVFASLNQVDFEQIKDHHFVNYPSAVNQFVNVAKPNYKFFRGVMPSWDNTPRRPNASSVFVNSSPESYKLFLKTIISLTKAEQTGDERMIFVNAWNEWAEGAHLEPDKKYGLKFLESTLEALNESGDYEVLMEEIKEMDTESRSFFTAARHLTEKIASSEEKINQLVQAAEKQQAQFGEQVTELTRRIEVQDQQILQFGKLLEQKELVIEKKETLVGLKEQHIKEQESRIQEIERLFHEQVDQQLLLKNRVNDLEIVSRQKEDQLLQAFSSIKALESDTREKEGQLSQALDSIKALESDTQEKEGQLALALSNIKDLEFDTRQIEDQLGEALNQIALFTAEKLLIDNTVAEQQVALSEKDALLQIKNQQISGMESVVASRVKLIQEQKAMISLIDQAAKEKDALNDKIKKQLTNALHQINVLNRTIHEQTRYVNSLYKSFSWRITRPIRWFHSLVFKTFYVFFPFRSRRWSVLKNIMHPGAKQQVVANAAVPQAAEGKKNDKKEAEISDADKEALKLINESRLFDLNWYLEANPDIKKAGVDPILHFLHHGGREGRKPNPLFDTKWYLLKHPGLVEAGVNPLIHYILHGKEEGCDPNPVFDGKWYLEQNPDVGRSGIHPLAHYLYNGAAERRNMLKPDVPATLSVKNLGTIAVICHVFYPELWVELSIGIRNILTNIELYVSIPRKNADEIQRIILQDFPSAHIKIVDNLGGDVYPFLLFLEEISLAGHRVFCKIHTKRGITNYGDLWRNVLLAGVLGSESISTTILNSFDADPDLSMAGSEILYKSAKFHEYGNRALTEQLYAKLYPNEVLPDDWGFFAGTMFWGRTSIFLPLARVIDAHFTFEQERLNIDGQLAHAIERILGAVVMHENGRIGLVSNELGITRSRELQVIQAPGIPLAETPERSLLRLREMYIRVFPHNEILDLTSPKTGDETLIGQVFGAFSGVSYQNKFPFLKRNNTSKPASRHCFEGGLERNDALPTILLCGHSAGSYLAGGEVSFLDMAQGVKNSGFNLIVVLPKVNPDYIAALNSYVCRFYVIPYKFWGVSDENKMHIQKIIKIIEFERISAVYVNTIMIREPLKAARIKGIPGITHVRELISADEVLTREIRKSKEDIRRKVISRSDYVIANSQATAKFFEKSDATFIIPNTIDLQDFNIKNSIDIKNITVGLISSNIPKKGIYEFIEIARICEEKLPNVRFLMIGEENAYIKELITNSAGNKLPQNLIFSGYCKRPVDAVSQANIVVNLSLFSESFGRTVLEAMAAGRPVIAYDFGAISELIEEGKNGYLVPFKDISAVVEKIEELVGNPHHIVSMGAYGREIAAKRYSKGIYDQTMKKVMNEILSNWPNVKAHQKRTGTGHTKGSSSAPLLRKTVSVSVLVTNYNYSRYLQERISSITSQTVLPTEIIFLDDASTDDSVAVAREIFSKVQIPFKIIANSTNQGIGRQWLKGIEEATGDYIWIAEADDSCSDSFLEKLTGRMTADNSVMGYCQSQRIDATGSLLAPNNLHHTDDLSRERWKKDFTEIGLREVVDYLIYRNSIPNASACLFRRSFLSEIPGEFLNYQFVGDWFLYCFLLSKGWISYLSEPLNKFRRHGDSVTRVKGKSDNYLAELVKIKKYITENFPVHETQLDKMVHFLDKDYKIEGIVRNSEYPAVADALKRIREKTTDRRRLVFLTTNNGSHNGGSEQLWIQTAVEARKRNHDVMVMIKKWDPAPYFFEVFYDLGIKILFKEEVDFNEIIRFKPDLMAISTGDQDEGTEWFDLCRQHNIPYAIINQLTKEPEYWPIRAEKTKPVTAGYLGAERTFFTSHNNHRVMEKRLSCTIPNASVFFQPFFIDREMQIPFPSTENGLHLALPARLLTIHKGQHLALEVINMEKWRNRKIHLNFYGVGPDEKKLRDMAESYGLDNVTFHEPRWTLPHPDLFDIWRENHAILMPSFMEGMPLVLLNAMICGRVPIVTDVGGHCEVIEDNVNGFIAAKPTVEDLDEAMERAYMQSGSWEEIGRKARETMLAYLPEDPIDHFVKQLLSCSNKND